MVDEAAVRRAADTAWTVYRAMHPHVDAQDGRRCLLERHLQGKRHLQGRWEAREGDAEELASFGLAYLHRLPADEC